MPAHHSSSHQPRVIGGLNDYTPRAGDKRAGHGNDVGGTGHDGYLICSSAGMQCQYPVHDPPNQRHALYPQLTEGHAMNDTPSQRNCTQHKDGERRAIYYTVVGLQSIRLKQANMPAA